MIFKEHPLSHKLKDSPISEYTPKWTRNNLISVQSKEKVIKNTVTKKKEKLGWNNF